MILSFLGFETDASKKSLVLLVTDLDDLRGFLLLGEYKVENELLGSFPCALLDIGERLNANTGRVRAVARCVFARNDPIENGPTMDFAIKPIFRTRNLAPGRFEHLGDEFSRCIFDLEVEFLSGGCRNSYTTQCGGGEAPLVHCP